MKTERILAAIFVVGLLFKFQHWPFAGMLLVLSLSSLAMIYFPAAFYFFSDKNIKQQNIPLSVISGLFLMFVPLGILFKVQFWPGFGITYLLIGSIAALIILVISYILRSKTSEELKTYYGNMIKRSVFLMCFGFFFFIIPTATLINIQEHGDPELARLKIQSYTNPMNEEYRNELKDYLIKRDSLRTPD